MDSKIKFRILLIYHHHDQSTSELSLLEMSETEDLRDDSEDLFGDTEAADSTTESLFSSLTCCVVCELCDV